MARRFGDGFESGDLGFVDVASHVPPFVQVLHKDDIPAYDSDFLLPERGNFVLALMDYQRYAQVNLDKYGIEDIAYFKFRYQRDFISTTQIFKIMAADKTTEHLSLNLSNMKLQLKRGSTVLGTGWQTLSNNTWHCIELYVKIHNSAGQYQCKLDGVGQFSGYAADTNNAGSDPESIGAVRLHNIYHRALFDDFAVDDSEFCGLGWIIGRYGESQGPYADVGWGGDYENVNEAPANDTTMILTDIEDAHESHDIQSPPADDAMTNIDAVYGCVRCLRWQESRVTKIEQYLQWGNVRRYFGQDITLPDAAPGNFQDVWETCPLGGVPWTKALLTDMLQGVRAKFS